MASCASWAFLAFELNWRGKFDKYSFPYLEFTHYLAALIACSERWTESVLIYVIKPLSYSPWAHLIVSLADNRSFRLASCCKVLVVKGGTGFLVVGFFSILSTFHSFSDKDLRKLFALSSLNIKELLPFFNLPVFSSKSEPLEIFWPSILNSFVSKEIPSFNKEAFNPQ